jgi:hypothetical protein
MSINVKSVVKVAALNGFTANQRVSAQDVETSPPQSYPGTIVSVFEDGTADVKFDFNLNFAAEKHLVRNGRVDLHHLNRQAA